MQNEQTKATHVANLNTTEETYRIWACDNQIYGPVDWATLTEWAAEGRVTKDTWIYFETAKEWRLARNLDTLRGILPPGESTTFFRRQAAAELGIEPGELRQFAVLAGLSNDDLVQLIGLGELVQARKDQIIIKRGDPGDALYFLLSGSARVRIFVGGDEKTLTSISAGEFFGDMAMFTGSPRSADVVANEDTKLFRFGAESFRVLISQNPSTAAPLLFGIAGTMAERIMDDNKRFQREVASGFVWR